VWRPAWVGEGTNVVISKNVIRLDNWSCCYTCFRNNLTIIDAVVVQGQGGYGELKFSNRKPGSQKPLIFEMTEKQLKNCDS